MCAHPARGNIACMIEARELTERVRRNVFVRSPVNNGSHGPARDSGRPVSVRLDPLGALGSRCEQGKIEDAYCLAVRTTRAPGDDLAVG